MCAMCATQLLSQDLACGFNKCLRGLTIHNPATLEETTWSNNPNAKTARLSFIAKWYQSAEWIQSYNLLRSRTAI